MRQIAETGNIGFELKIHSPDRPVPLLADDDFGPAADKLHFRHPLLEFGRTFSRLCTFNIVLFAVHEHDHVGVLFDGARFAQVRELRPLVLAVLNCAREL